MTVTAPVSAAAVLAVAAHEIGDHEDPAGSNKQKFGAWYGMNGQPWCAMFVSWVMHQAGWDGFAMATAKGYAYCPDGVNWFKKQRAWAGPEQAPQPGWIVFYEFSGSVSDHTGIVRSAAGPGDITAIEGNTDDAGGSTGGQVMEKHRTAGILGYGVISYQEDDMPLTQTDLDAVAAAVWGDKITLSDGTVQPAWAVLRFVQQDGHTAAAMASKAAGEQADPAAIAQAVLAGLDPKAIAAAIPGDLAKQVADELHNRLAG